MAFFDLFALDMQRVLNDEIVEVFDGLEPVPLSPESLGLLAEHESSNPNSKKGLYILHHRGEAVYVGKAEDSIRVRLEDHRLKLASRQNITVADISFRCLYLDKNWSALTHEKPLIERFAYRWNATGFGNHDPGRNRDRTELKENHFDRLHPINENLMLEFDAGERTVATALNEIKSQLPFLLRFQTQRGFRPSRSHPDYEENMVSFNGPKSLRDALGSLVDALGSDWQVTFLYGYVILYREHYEYKENSALMLKVGCSDWNEIGHED